MRPKNPRIPPEIYVHTAGWTETQAAEYFKRSVKISIETHNEKTTMYGVDLLLRVAELPKTTGITGSIHGASTVKNPDKNDTSKSTITVV